LPAYDGATRTAWVSAHSNSMGNWTTAPDATSQYEIVRAGPIIGAMGRHDIVWDGFHVRERDNYHPDTGPVVIWDSQDVVIMNSDLEGQVQLLLDNHNTVRLNGATRPVVRNNRIHGLGFPDDVGPNNPQNHAAIMIYVSDDAVIEHNEIYDSYTGLFPKGGNAGHVIRYNAIHDCVKAFRFSYHSNLRVYQNAVYDSENAFQFAENIADVAVFNNVVHAGASGANNWFPVAGAASFNNIYLDVDYPNMFDGGVGTLMSDFNVYAGFGGFVPGDDFQGWQGMGFDAASIAADPQFVNATARDYHLAGGSPALAAGRDLGDLDGDQDVNETIPAGAYVTGDEIIGRLPDP
jgi:hypothetical protein